ncbi:MAG: tyrosine-type recombinase/integrase [Chloroflexota bacterium]|nr:tyrosine-type recombinase/integrase [Chloroflexota bacterium]
MLAQLSRWLDYKTLKAQEITKLALAEYVQARRDAGCTSFVSERALQPLLIYLRQLGVVPEPAAADDPIEELLGRYRAYLNEERGVTAGTIACYATYVHHFLSERATASGLDLHELSGADVIQFVRRESRRVSVRSAKNVVTALRSVLRFLYLAGEAPARAAVVPAVAAWKAAGLPRTLPLDQVDRILDSCDRTSDSGRLDYAMLILLAQLGLRAGEVVRLELDDLDWLRGELVIRGKGNRFERLPLPQAVGEALSDYLVHSRPRVDSRRVFLRTRAPAGGFIGIGGVSRAMAKGCRRAGLPAVGTHWLRRSLGTQMLRKGASLQEVGQVLRHRALATTSLYVKLDRRSLADLARPWPMVAA